MRFHPVKYAFDERLDPASSPMYRLFLFWHSYVEEEKLLQDWHNLPLKYHSPPTTYCSILFLTAGARGDGKKSGHCAV